MYRVRMESKQEGRKKVKRCASTDIFLTEQEAQDFIDSCIHKQEQICWKAWGLMVTDKRKDGSKLIVDYNPAIIFYAKLTQTFEIVAA